MTAKKTGTGLNSSNLAKNVLGKDSNTTIFSFRSSRLKDLNVKTVSSLRALETVASIDWENFPVEKSALEHYFLTGGIVRVHSSSENKVNPALIYPTKLRLRELIREKDDLRKLYEKKQSLWKKGLSDAKDYLLQNNLKKFSNPLYWKHLAKCFSDKEYKKNVDAVKLPINLVADKRWQPMIKTFLEDEEYRSQLVETVSESIVYRKDKRVGKYAEDLQEFRTVECSKNLKAVEAKIAELQRDLNAFNSLMKWASSQ